MTRRLLFAAAAAIAILGAISVALREDTSDAVRGPTATTGTTTTTIVGEPGADGVGDPYFPMAGNGGYDVVHYGLEITWNPDDGSIQGRTTIEARALQNLSRFNLDLSGLDVSSVEVDGVVADQTRYDRELEITPAAIIPAGQTFTTVVVYAGKPMPVTDGTDLFDVGWQTDGREAFVVSEPVGASTFFPSNDHPADKASYTFTVTAPADQSVIANGRLVSPPTDAADGHRTWTYEARDQMATYLVQLVIGDYELVDAGVAGDVVIRHAFHRSAAKAAAVSVSRTAEMMGVLVDVYGPFPFEAYGVVVVNERLGFALETQTLTIIGTDIGSAGRRADNVLLHELAHQWVGNSVSLSSWKDIWLNEGFATYSEWLWMERTGGPSAAQSARVASGNRGLETAPGDPGSKELFARTVYARGGQTLQALREQLGDEPFFQVLRAWVDKHRGGNATTQDFVDLAERISGQQLDDLFSRWLYAPGLQRLG